jgi:hypothetical protein
MSYPEARMPGRFVSMEDIRKVAGLFPQEPELPFSRWKFYSVIAPRSKPYGFRWWLLKRHLRRVMNRGGVVVIVGETRSGKTCLLESLKLQKIIQLVTIHSSIPVRIPMEEVPAKGLFAIDETHYHHVEDVTLILSDKNRGCAVTFQAERLFCESGLGVVLADRSVTFLEFKRSL